MTLLPSWSARTLAHFPLQWLLIGAYGCLLAYGSVNLPYADDFDWAIGFMGQYQHATTLGEKLSLLFSFHNEHCLVFTRLVVLGWYVLTGTINFKVLTLLGNWGLITVMLLLWQTLRQYPAWVKLILVFLLLSPATYHNQFFTFGLSNHSVIAFAALAFVWMAKPGRWLMGLTHVHFRLQRSD